MTRKVITLATAVMATALFVPLAEAQSVRRLNSTNGYQIPGTGLRMWPPPRYEYRINGLRIYTNRNNWNQNQWNGSGYWPYRGNNWSYGYPKNYNWPYGNSVRVRRGW